MAANRRNKEGGVVYIPPVQVPECCNFLVMIVSEASAADIFFLLYANKRRLIKKTR